MAFGIFCAQVINIFPAQCVRVSRTDCGFFVSMRLLLQKFSGSLFWGAKFKWVTRTLYRCRARRFVAFSHSDTVALLSLKYAITYRWFAPLAQSKQFSFVKCFVLSPLCYTMYMASMCAHSQNPVSQHTVSQTHTRPAYSLNEMMSHINNSIILHSCSYDGFKPHLLTG